MDLMFLNFLQSQVTSLRTSLEDSTLAVDTVIEKAYEIKKLEARIDRMQNPITRTRKSTTSVPVPVAETVE